MLAFVLLLAAIGVLAAVGCSGEGTEQESAGPDASATAIFSPGQPEEVNLRLEVARTSAERAKGLMDRSSLASDQGMLFVFERPAQGAFWMKNTYIPLSIAFVSQDGVILDIQDMEPLSLEQHRPASAYSYAIEANKGFFSDNGIAAGDRVQLEDI